jgi:hypothetical protein
MERWDGSSNDDAGAKDDVEMSAAKKRKGKGKYSDYEDDEQESEQNLEEEELEDAGGKRR